MTSPPLTPESDYPDDWDSRRRKVYSRDEYKCQNCGSGGGPNGENELHAHHVVPVKRGGSHQLSNLITLCDECHSLVHNRPLGSLQDLPSIRDDNYTTQSSPDVEDYQNELLAVTLQCIKLFDYVVEFKLEVESEDNQPEKDNIMPIFEQYTVVRYNLRDTREIYEQVESRLGLSMFSYSFELGILSSLDEKIGLICDEVHKVSSGLLVAHGFCPSCFSTVSSDSLMCTDCRDDPDMVGQCPECGVQISNKYDFCPSCDTDLSEIDESSADLPESRFEYASEKINNGLSGLSDIGMDFFIAVTKGIMLVKDNMTSFDWEYCPYCGERHSVWNNESTEDGPFCILCRCKWEETGLIWKKWKILTPNSEQAEKAKRTKKSWSDLGRKRNESETYKKYHNELSGEESIKLLSYVYKVVS